MTLMGTTGQRGIRHCIVPPHILRQIARNGTPSQRDRALATLAVDSTARTQRAFAAPPATRRSALDVQQVPVVHRTVDTANNQEVEPGTLVRAEGGPAIGDLEANEAYDGLGATFDFYFKNYNRNSIDNHGLPLVATVHYGRDYDNAFWDGSQMVFGDGDREAFNRFTISLDVIGHELTHGVTASEVNLSYMGQSGALNESVSDVFGSLVKQYALKQTADQADWLIGAGLLTFKDQALRSMKAPGTAYDNELLGKDPQPADMQHYVHTAQDNGGVHVNSGIPNHAFYLAATKLGGHAWERAGQVWYDAIRDRTLRPSADFRTFAAHTVTQATRRYGGGSEAAAVRDAWHQVGVMF